jgi:hypothetical protein
MAHQKGLAHWEGEFGHTEGANDTGNTLDLDVEESKFHKARLRHRLRAAGALKLRAPSGEIPTNGLFSDPTL